MVAQQNLPENLAGRRYYEPTDRGDEAELARRLEKIRSVYATIEPTQPPPKPGRKTE